MSATGGSEELEKRYEAAKLPAEFLMHHSSRRGIYVQIASWAPDEGAQETATGLARVSVRHLPASNHDTSLTLWHT